MTAPDNCRYAADHVWARLEGDIVSIGITDHAQDELSDVVFVELPDMGDVDKASPVVIVESVIDSSDIYTPIAGEIIEINIDLVTDPTKINSDPYDTGWIFKMRIDDTSQYDALMDASSYIKTVR